MYYIYLLFCIIIQIFAQYFVKNSIFYKQIKNTDLFNLKSALKYLIFCALSKYLRLQGNVLIKKKRQMIYHMSIMAYVILQRKIKKQHKTLTRIKENKTLKFRLLNYLNE